MQLLVSLDLLDYDCELGARVEDRNRFSRLTSVYSLPKAWVTGMSQLSEMHVGFVSILRVRVVSSESPQRRRNLQFYGTACTQNFTGFD